MPPDATNSMITSSYPNSSSEPTFYQPPVSKSRGNSRGSWVPEEDDDDDDDYDYINQKQTTNMNRKMNEQQQYNYNNDNRRGSDSSRPERTPEPTPTPPPPCRDSILSAMERNQELERQDTHRVANFNHNSSSSSRNNSRRNSNRKQRNSRSSEYNNVEGEPQRFDDEEFVRDVSFDSSSNDQEQQKDDDDEPSSSHQAPTNISDSEQTPSKPNEPLHKTLYTNLTSDLHSLRTKTIAALHYSANEQERLCLQGEELETRIYCMRKKMELIKVQLKERGVEIEGIVGEDNEEEEEDVRLSILREGGGEEEDLTEEEDGGGGDRQGDMAVTTTPMKHTSNSGGNGGRHHNESLGSSKGSKRYGSMHSSLHSSNTTARTSISEASAMPHMSRSSLLGMLGASKTWLDAHNSTSTKDLSSATANGGGGGGINNVEETNRPSIMGGVMRMSFLDGGDGMPSRWKAREQQREKSEKKQKEKELKQRRRSSIEKIEKERRQQQQQQRNGMSNNNNRQQLTRSEQLQELISQREAEIATLEDHAMTVSQQTSMMNDQIYTLQKSYNATLSNYTTNKTQLDSELNDVNTENHILDRQIVQAGVSLEEQKIIMDIFAVELKTARSDLAHVQNELEYRKKKNRSKRSNMRNGGSGAMNWMRNSVSSLMGLDLEEDGDGDEVEGGGGGGQGQEKGGEEQWQRRRKDKSSSSSAQQQHQLQQQGAASAGGMTRYQVPTNALHTYRTLVGADADDSTVASGDYLESSGDSGEDPYGSGNGRQLRRKSRQNSISTCMSALTLDSCELVDILENLEV